MDKNNKNHIFAVIRFVFNYIFAGIQQQKEVPVDLFFCGAGRTRTAVQTSNKSAFYMLIRWLVVGAAPDIGTQGHP